MPGFLFHDVIFGPVRSRRLGLSLGINLLPKHSKYCSFNCIYCECGWTPVASMNINDLPSREEVNEYLEQRLQELAAEDYLPDALTYAGNGEPTLHPQFAEIVDDTIRLRDKYTRSARIAVLSNGSMIHDPKVFDALLRIDDNILKLDAGSERIFRLMNNPLNPITFSTLIENMKRFNGQLIIQSMFLRGYYNGQLIDNTSDDEVDRWIGRLLVIKPRVVMIYSIARATPAQDLEKIATFELEKIAGKLNGLGIETKVYH